MSVKYFETVVVNMYIIVPICFRLFAIIEFISIVENRKNIRPIGTGALKEQIDSNDRETHGLKSCILISV